MKQYLTSLRYSELSDIVGVYYTPHHKAGYRFFSKYGTDGERSRRKQQIFDYLDNYGQSESRGEWDWHHVVEKVHLKPLFSPSTLKVLYEQHWPVTLIHAKTEHQVLNSLFRDRGTKLGLETMDGKPLEGSERQKYIDTLQMRYRDIYTGDEVLRTVASNVIRALKNGPFAN